MRRFRNWSRVYESSPTRWETPSTEAEVAAILTRATAERTKVRPVGSGHSWSDVALPTEAALDLTRMRRVLAIDASARTIRVQAGILLRELTAALDEVGLAMPILGSVSEQSIAGAISTGTHGSSLGHGNLASLVRSMRLVTGTGDVLALGPGDERLEAARVAIGVLGVITEVELDVVPAFRLVESVELVSPLRVAESLPAIAKSAPFVKVWWLPHTGPMHVFRYAPSSLPAEENHVARFLDEHVVNPYVFPAVLALARALPSTARPIHRAVARGYLDHPRAKVARSDHAFNVAMPPLHDETEWALDFEAARDVVRDLIGEIELHRWSIDFPLEIRFVRADQAWLSPAYGRDTVHVGAYATRSDDQRAYFAAFEQLAKAALARPHWGKECTLDPAYVRAVFPESARFLALREQLDPARVLVNAHVERALG